MDLTSGAGLVAAIAETLNRQDLTATIPAWVRMAEVQIERQLRVRDMIQRSTTITSDPYIVLPSDFLELKSLQLLSPTTQKRVLRQTSNDDLLDMQVAYERAQIVLGPVVYPSCDARGPKAYTILDGMLHLAPDVTGATTIEMVYYGQIPALDCTRSDASTWLLDRAPDVLLHAALTFSAPYLQEDDRTQIWSQIASSAIDKLNAQADAAEHNGSRLNMPRRTF